MRRSLLLFVGAAAAAAIVAFSPSSVQAAETNDVALAETLFQQGKALLAKGSYAEACAKLGESQRIDPGDGTLLTLATCHEAEGKLALAWSEYSSIANKSDARADRAQRAKERISAIEPKLARLSVMVPRATMEKTPSLEILRDDVALGRGAWNTASPIDPGAHVIEARAEGMKPFRIEVQATSGGRLEVVVPPLSASSSSPAAAATPQPASSSSAAEHRSSGYASRGTALRVTGITLGALGLATVVAGGYFGVRAFDLSDRAKAGCEGGCTDDALNTNKDAKSSAQLANYLVIGGGAAAVTGLVLYLIAPKSQPVSPWVDPRGAAGVTLTRSF
jgi:hypothetical protein